MNLFQKSKIISIVIACIFVVSVVSAVTILFSMMRMQNKSIEKQVARLDDLTKQLEDKNVLLKKESIVNSKKTVKEKYIIDGRKLIVKKINGETAVLVPDIMQAGFQPTFAASSSCEKDFRVYSEFLSAKKIVFEEACIYPEAVETEMWSFDIQKQKFRKMPVNSNLFEAISPDKRFRIGLGKEDSDGEIRRLRLVDFLEEKKYDINLLPQSLTYLQSILELDGSPIGDISWGDSGGGPVVQVFSAGESSTLINSYGSAIRKPILQFWPCVNADLCKIDIIN